MKLRSAVWFTVGALSLVPCDYAVVTLVDEIEVAWTAAIVLPSVALIAAGLAYFTRRSRASGPLVMGVKMHAALLIGTMMWMLALYLPIH
jgi:hypothetical protein